MSKFGPTPTPASTSCWLRLAVQSRRVRRARQDALHTVRGATLGVLGHTHRHDGEKRFFRMLEEHFDIGTEAIDGGITLSTLTRETQE